MQHSMPLSVICFSLFYDLNTTNRNIERKSNYAEFIIRNHFKKNRKIFSNSKIKLNEQKYTVASCRKEHILCRRNTTFSSNYLSQVSLELTCVY
uniref:Secreted protein n=1 Tax=Heterorhabditis bacteriophora TaxID=37862 RepID=A0A1I7WFC5_HETBA